MLRVIKLGELIYENVEPRYVDENGKEVWIVPNTVSELQKALADTLAWLEKQRLQKVLDSYGYNGLADVYIYASQNDTEAQAILSWYTNSNGNGYDDLIWNWIDTQLPQYQTVDELLSIDLRQVEEQIYQQSVQNNPLP